MSKNLEIQEVAVVVKAKNYDPNLLNPNFLKYSGIINEDWELARQPIVSNRASQIIFNNGIYLAAQPNRFSFVEALNNKKTEESIVPNLINKYVEILRNLESQAIGINFRGYIVCNDTTVQSNTYLNDRFILPGEWQQCGDKPVKSRLTFMFTYAEKQLLLSIAEGGIKLPEQEQSPIVLFEGNFEYELDSVAPEQKLERLQNIIQNWQQDLAIYQDVVGKMVAKEEVEKEAVPA